MHVLTWGMGYIPGDTERAALRLEPARSVRHAFKHHRIILMGGQMEAYGLAVIETERALGTIERWWGLAIPPKQWRIPPDRSASSGAGPGPWRRT